MSKLGRYDRLDYYCCLSFPLFEGLFSQGDYSASNEFLVEGDKEITEILDSLKIIFEIDNCINVYSESIHHYSINHHGYASIRGSACIYHAMSYF